MIRFGDGKLQNFIFCYGMAQFALVTLKIAGALELSWTLVLLPLWLPVLGSVVIAMLLVAGLVVAFLVALKLELKYRKDFYDARHPNL